MTMALSSLAVDAQQMAHSLVGDLRNRWRHTVGVAQRAAELAGPLGLDHDLLVAGAWLHDIGYAEVAQVTGFHPLDGADYLAARDWPGHIASLVAHHSGARFIAAARGLGDRLAAYPDLGGLLADALTYADQTVGPCGDRVAPADRYAEMMRRHGPGSWNAKVDHLRRPHLQAVARRVEAHLIGA
jgi:putative nucleotidyltransferase with HDIG domain